ncbi:hypothetical protein EWB00_000461 [Schistosoma japonicum]|uniref:Uncharacterized protein n=1 Tax=Schistosoma japonicum TaxID=6182 RepID=A0A4Z2CK76_SCHJA|nr:hypothetical protein EWB00_000461 [Schistosoma japonicum]
MPLMPPVSSNFEDLSPNVNHHRPSLFLSFCWEQEKIVDVLARSTRKVILPILHVIIACIRDCGQQRSRPLLESVYQWMPCTINPTAVTEIEFAFKIIREQLRFSLIINRSWEGHWSSWKGN